MKRLVWGGAFRLYLTLYAIGRALTRGSLLAYNAGGKIRAWLNHRGFDDERGVG